MGSKNGGAGFFVPEEAWNEFEDLIGVAEFISATLDGSDRSIIVSSNSLRSLSNTLHRTLSQIREVARFLPGTHTSGEEDEYGGESQRE